MMHGHPAEDLPQSHVLFGTPFVLGISALIHRIWFEGRSLQILDLAVSSHTFKTQTTESEGLTSQHHGLPESRNVV